MQPNRDSLPPHPQHRYTVFSRDGHRSKHQAKIWARFWLVLLCLPPVLPENPSSSPPVVAWVSDLLDSVRTTFGMPHIIQK